MQQGAERRVVGGFLGDDSGPIADRHRGDAVIGPRVGQPGFGENLTRGTHHAKNGRRQTTHVPGADPCGAEPRRLPQRVQKVVLRLVDLIFHGRLVERLRPRPAEIGAALKSTAG